MNPDSIPNNDLLNAPFDLAVPPETLLVTDCPGQHAALQAVSCAPDSDTDESSKFFNEPQHSKSLNYFKQLYDNRQSHTARGLLTKRIRVEFRSPAYTTPSDSNTIAWDMNRHYLDMMVCVGKGLGLGALIPNQHANSMYEIHLEFKQRIRNFHTKYARLGFNPRGSMLWIGKTPSSEDIWIAWVPETVIDGEDEDIEEGNTSLAERHYRATVMFFAAMLSAIGYRDIIVSEQYPDLTSQEDFVNASNIL